MKNNAIFSPYRVEQGSVGQDYLCAFARMMPPVDAEKAVAIMRKQGIFIGANQQENTIYLSALNLSETKYDIVYAALVQLEG